MKKKHVCVQGAPDWVLTYGDMMSLLLCFFIMLAAMSEIKKDDTKFQMVMDSLRQAFGNSGEMRAIPSEMLEPNSLLRRLQEIVVQQKRDHGDSDDPGIHGKSFRVTDINEGIHVEIGGRITFERFSATLKEESRSLIEQVAARTAGHKSIVKVTGHATREPLPANSSWSDTWDLGYARACAVRDVLISAGIDAARIRLISAGAEAPVMAQAFSEAELALNRRVEIVVTEATVLDYEDVADDK